MVDPTGEGLARLLVDVRPVDHPTARDRGIGRYTLGLLGGLYAAGAPVVGLYANETERLAAVEAVPGLALERLCPATIRRHTHPGTWYLATQLMLHPIPLDPVPSIITRAGLPVAAVMYDVIPERYPERYQVQPAARAQVRLRGMLARTLDALLAISGFAADTAADALRFPRERISTIGAGFDPAFIPAPSDPWPRLRRVLDPSDRATVVAVVGADPRKNVERLLGGWGLLPRATRDGHRLVLAGANDAVLADRWHLWAEEAGLTLDEWTATGGLTDDEMVAVHQVAVLAVMPSTEEGFGLPVLEAAACGCPVITSDVSSLPEVLAHPPAEFDPHDPGSIGTAIDRALGDQAHRADLLAAGVRATERWTWERTGRAVVDSLTRLGPAHSRPLRQLPRRIALAGRFDGSSAGRALSELAEALRALPDAPDVDELVDWADTPTPTHGGPGRFPVRALGRFVPLSLYDHVVAFPSPGAAATAALASRRDVVALDTGIAASSLLHLLDGAS